MGKAVPDDDLPDNAVPEWDLPGAKQVKELPAGDRFKRGFIYDPISGLKQLGAMTEFAGLVAPDWAKKVNAESQRNEAEYQSEREAAGQKGVDWWRLGGNIVNPVNLGIAALTKTPPNASMLARMTMGAAGGGMISGLAPVYGDASREKQMAAGMVGGAVAAPIAAGLSRIVKPKVDPQVKMLREAGVTPTLGQSLGGMAKSIEDKATSFPIMGDAIGSARAKGMNEFQRAAYSRALNPVGLKPGAEVGFEGMTNVHQKLSQAYDDLLPKLSFKPDQQFSTGTQQLRAGLQGLDSKSRNIYDAAIKRIVGRATPQGNMSGETFKNVESSLGDEIKALVKDGSYEKGKVAEALMQYRDLMRQGLERSNPGHAKELAKINEGWANYAILRRAASGPQAAQTGNFTPAQLMQGVQESAKRAGQAAGRAKLSEGTALMQDLATAGQKVLPSKYPDSGSIGRLGQQVLLNPFIGIPKAAAGATFGAVGSIPYLPGVRKAVDLSLNARPEAAKALAELLRSNPALFAPVAPAVVGGIK